MYQLAFLSSNIKQFNNWAICPLFQWNYSGLLFYSMRTLSTYKLNGVELDFIIHFLNFWRKNCLYCKFRWSNIDKKGPSICRDIYWLYNISLQLLVCFNKFLLWPQVKEGEAKRCPAHVSPVSHTSALSSSLLQEHCCCSSPPAGWAGCLWQFMRLSIRAGSINKYLRATHWAGHWLLDRQKKSRLCALGEEN